MEEDDNTHTHPIRESIAEIIPAVIEDESLSTAKKGKILEQYMELTIQRESFCGPIPPPEVMQKYEVLIPGAADRILKMAEAQSEHRMRLESECIPRQQKESARGQWLAFTLAFLLIISACYAMYLGNAAVAGGVFSVTIIAVVTTFIIGKKRIKQDMDQKNESDPN